MSQHQQQWAQKLLSLADIQINGARPWDIQVTNPSLYSRVLGQGSLGLGEAYMDGWFECQQLDQFFNRLFLARIQDHVKPSFALVLELAKARLFNLQVGARAYEVGSKHYDLGNDFFAAMLGESMVYSCGYWSGNSETMYAGKETDDLSSAQYAKLDLICRKLNLQPGQKILDIGSGWGSFAKYAAQNYKVSVVGVTVSKEQAEFAIKACQGLPVEFRFQDYHNLHEKFDHIVSVGMFEHVGLKNYQSYFEVAKKCLKENGLFLLHTIGSLESDGGFDPWLNKYIFPNAALPSLQHITGKSEKLFVVEDVHNLGPDYDKTLMAWYNNFKKHWPEFENKYDQRFYRMWEYYVLSCAALFRSRTTQLWQVVLSPHGVQGGYKTVR